MHSAKRAPGTPPEIVVLPAEGFILQSTYCVLLGGISAPTFWRMRKVGRISPPIKLTSKLNAWPVETVRCDIKRLTAQGSATASLQGAGVVGRVGEDRNQVENCESCHVQPWTQQRGKNGPRFCGRCADIAERECA